MVTNRIRETRAAHPPPPSSLKSTRLSVFPFRIAAVFTESVIPPLPTRFVHSFVKTI